MASQLCLVAYRVLDEDGIKLLVVRPREKFYRDRKRVES
jgi:hypothetical protein